MAQQNNPFAQDMVRMQLPAGHGSVIALAGFSLEADEEGCVTVPARYVDDLKAHGLLPAPAVSPPKTITARR